MTVSPHGNSFYCSLTIKFIDSKTLQKLLITWTDIRVFLKKKYDYQIYMFKDTVKNADYRG